MQNQLPIALALICLASCTRTRPPESAPAAPPKKLSCEFTEHAVTPIPPLAPAASCNGRLLPPDRGEALQALFDADGGEIATVTFAGGCFVFAARREHGTVVRIDLWVPGADLPQVSWEYDTRGASARSVGHLDPTPSEYSADQWRDVELHRETVRISEGHLFQASHVWRPDVTDKQLELLEVQHGVEKRWKYGWLFEGPRRHFKYNDGY
jgi:hypothetical protein